MTTCTYQGLQYATYLKPKQQIQLASVNRVINKISERYGLSTDELKSTSRKAEIVEARRFVINILRETTSITLTALGDIFNRDHSTVIYTIQSHADLMAFNSKYKAKYNRVVEIIFES